MYAQVIELPGLQLECQPFHSLNDAMWIKINILNLVGVGALEIDVSH